MATLSARFWFVWATVLVGWFFFVKVTLDLLAVLGVSQPAVYLVGLACGVVLVGLTCTSCGAIPPVKTARSGAASGWRLAALDLRRRGLAAAVHRLETPFYVGVICCCCRSRSGAFISRWLTYCARGQRNGRRRAVAGAVTVERGLRAALLIGSAYLIAWLLGLDLAAMTMRDTMATRLLRGAINAVVIVLLADFGWHLARAWIDWRLVEASDGGEADAEEIRRRARLRTLLPILRNVLLVVLVVMAVLMALAALGIRSGH